MHKGRIYPYTPYYWTTEGWFWPGFVPWKMDCEILEPYFPPWDTIVPSAALVSDAGIVDYSRKLITYHWTLIYPQVATDMWLSLEKLYYPDPWCRWRASIGIAGVETAVAYYFQPFPQIVVGEIDDAQWRLLDDPNSITGGPRLQYGPTNYADGGSPWP